MCFHLSRIFFPLNCPLPLPILSLLSGRMDTTIVQEPINLAADPADFSILFVDTGWQSSTEQASIASTKTPTIGSRFAECTVEMGPKYLAEKR